MTDRQPPAIAPLVSIVLPTRNGISTLPALFDSIARQRVDFAFEVVAVDSSSDDGTSELLRERADRLISIRAESFNHGLTRNLGIEQARGDLLVMLVQDALPASDDWLAELTTPLQRDATLAGTFARQRPRPDAGAITRHYLASWVAASEQVRTVALADKAELDAAHPIDRLTRCAFDNVCSCIRRSVWIRHPFRETPIAEDLEWAQEVLQAGYRLMYVPRAVVIHSHDRSARYELERTYLLHRRLFELFQVRTIPNVRLLARAIATSLVVHVRCERASAKSGRSRLGRAVALAFAMPLGQYLGGLSAVKGWQPLRSRQV